MATTFNFEGQKRATTFSWYPQPTYSSWNKWTHLLTKDTAIEWGKDIQGMTPDADGLYEFPMSDQEVVGWICWDSEMVNDLLRDHNILVSNRGDAQEIARHREQLKVIVEQVFKNVATLAQDCARHHSAGRENWVAGLHRQQFELADVAHRIKNTLKFYE